MLFVKSASIMGAASLISISAAAASEPDDLFSAGLLELDEQPMSVNELGEARGGFSFGGLDFNIGVQVLPPTVNPLPNGPFGSSGGPFGSNGGPFGQNGGPFGQNGGPFGGNGGPFGGNGNSNNNNANQNNTPPPAPQNVAQATPPPAAPPPTQQQSAPPPAPAVPATPPSSSSAPSPQQQAPAPAPTQPQPQQSQQQQQPTSVASAPPPASAAQTPPATKANMAATLKDVPEPQGLRGIEANGLTTVINNSRNNVFISQERIMNVQVTNYDFAMNLRRVSNVTSQVVSQSFFLPGLN